MHCSKIIVALFLFCFSTAITFAQRIEYKAEDSIRVEKILHEAIAKRGSENRMLYFGKQFLGIPYVGHTLEKGSEEHLIVNLRELDCTTFVETVAALALCDSNNSRTFRDYCNNLRRLRYRNGEIKEYPSRLHYFTWWAQDNERKGIVKCISSDKSPFTATQVINLSYMSAHPQSYTHLKDCPDYVKAISDLEKKTKGERYPFIPKALLNQGQSTALGVIHDGDIVAMLSSKPGLDTQHIGIAVWQNGHLHLLNASSLYHKVVLDSNTLYNYMNKQKTQTGIRVFRITE